MTRQVRRRKRPWHKLRQPGASFIEPVLGTPQQTIRALKNSLVKFNRCFSKGVMTPKVVVDYTIVSQRGKDCIQVRSLRHSRETIHLRPRVYLFYTLGPGEEALYRLTPEEAEVHGEHATSILERKVRTAAKNYQVRHDPEFTYQMHIEPAGVVFKRLT